MPEGSAAKKMMEHEWLPLVLHRTVKPCCLTGGTAGFQKEDHHVTYRSFYLT